MTAVDWKALVGRATQVREHAYAPYSGYRVGAALLAADGRVFVGCNVENASYGATSCAERGAVAAMVAAGVRAAVAVAVVTQGPEAAAPCGICRQVLAELAPGLEVGMAIAGEPAPRRVVSLAELLPEAFTGKMVTG